MPYITINHTDSVTNKDAFRVLMDACVNANPFMTRALYDAEEVAENAYDDLMNAIYDEEPKSVIAELEEEAKAACAPFAALTGMSVERVYELIELAY